MDSNGISRSSFLARTGKLLLGLVGTQRIARAASPAAPKSGAPLYVQDFAAFREKSLDQKVQEIADREEIRELIARYAHRIAHGVGVAELFTDDCAFILRIPGRPVQEIRTQAALAKNDSLNIGSSDTPKPMIHNYLLVISGDDATGICSNEVRMTEKGQSMIGSGYYDDRFRRENGRWKFVSREATFFHWVPIQQGWGSPPSAKPT